VQGLHSGINFEIEKKRNSVGPYSAVGQCAPRPRGLLALAEVQSGGLLGHIYAWVMHIETRNMGNQEATTLLRTAA
jgi:hypothetical protein